MKSCQKNLSLVQLAVENVKKYSHGSVQITHIMTILRSITYLHNLAEQHYTYADNSMKELASL